VGPGIVTTPRDGNPRGRLIRRLRRLDLGQGPLDVRRIAEGITNHNYVVKAGGQRYVARLCRELPILGIDRRNEAVCQQAASDRGLAPEVIHHQNGLLVTRFVDGRTLEAGDVGRPETIVRLADLLRRLHQGWDTLTGEILYFCPFQAIRTYARSASRLRAQGPVDLPALLERADLLARRIAPFRPALCHNDLLPANLIDDGRRLWVVDWEYAGMGHTTFDLANVAANAAFSDDQDRTLLAAYRNGGSIDPCELVELRIFKAASFLRDALWGLIQTVASDIDFDYQQYAAGNFEGFRRAAERVERR
jgi:thiamine kinase-like enzyme